MSPPDDIEDYLTTIRAQEGAEATWIETVWSTREGSLRNAWGRHVHVFALHGHPSASQAFAWRGLGWRATTIYVVFRLPPVESAADAVGIALRTGGRLMRELLAEARAKRNVN